MKRSALLPLLILLAACASGPQSGSSSSPGHGAIAIQVQPNPIQARLVSGDTYDFPFELVVRETGGRSVTVTSVTASVFGPGGIPLGRETWNAEAIRGRGFSTSVPAGGELRYQFSPRKEVPDERLFGGVTAELRIEAVDETGTAATASTTVTVTR